jgi:hypothetical protein
METLYGGKRLDRFMPVPKKPTKEKKCNSSEMGSVIGKMVASTAHLPHAGLQYRAVETDPFLVVYYDFLALNDILACHSHASIADLVC